jgi:hypothetical protein
MAKPFRVAASNVSASITMMGESCSFRTRQIRNLKDRISREFPAGLEQANIGIASSAYKIVGVPPIRIEPLPVINPQGELRARPEPLRFFMRDVALPDPALVRDRLPQERDRA